MRLHRLTFRAVGPFSGEHTVDFDRLGSSGLFLLEGPTGSGKSSIIDAVVFALYGQVAGQETSNDRMHSDFAEPGVEPFVELDFSTASGLYRVRRTPKYERPKQRGSGATTQNATAKLWRLTSPDADPGEPLTTRIEETASQLLDAVGLSREQFVQTVVLPQGEFASFLRAPAEARREVLQRLFGTEVYDRVVRALEDMRRKAQESRRESEVRVREAVAAFGGAAGLEPSVVLELGERADDDEALLAACSAAAALLTDETGQLRVAASSARDAADLAATTLVQARDREQRRARKEQLSRRRQTLDDALPQQADRRERLERAERAERVRALLDGLSTSEQRLASLEHRLAQARETLPDELREAGLEEWDAGERLRRGKAAELTPMVEVEKSLANLRSRLLDAEGEAAAVLRLRTAAEEAQVLLPREISALQVRRDAALERVSKAQAAESGLTRAGDQLAAAQRVVELTAQIATARADAEREGAVARLAQQHEHELRQRHIDGMAGLLAAALEPEQPCPVCGSVDHPQPAQRAADDVDATEVDQAEDVRRQAMTAVERASATVAELNAELSAASARAEGVSLADARTALTSAELDVADAELARSDVARLDADLTQAQERLAQVTVESTALAARAATAAASVSSIQGTIQDTLVRLDSARGGFATVSERITALGESADGLGAAAEVARGAKAAAEQRADWLRRVEQACEQQGFATVTQAQAEVQLESDRDELAREIAQFDQDAAAVSSALSDPALEGIDVSAAVDLGPLVEAEKQAAEASRQGHTRVAAAEQRSTAATAALAAVAASLARRREDRAATSVVIRTANLMAASSSDNARAMTLPTYVLLERFKSVVAAANERLVVMSDGRYALEHVEVRDAGRRSGLGLQVRDTHTEQARDPKTLSGGETFYCSLAMALGLADVVTAEAGGIDLGTLFVDEGFGTLDPDTLEQVVGVLGGLRAGGRVVGIVSHVPELKERISERVVVRRNPDGSSRLEVVA